MKPPAPHLGVVMLDTRFPRPPGDIGNPASFDFPVSYERVRGLDVAAVVSKRPLAGPLVEDIVAAAARLQARGATLVTTSCGFLAGLQQRLARELSVPVITSSLCLLPGLRERHGDDARLGVLTFSAARLRPHHFGEAWDPRLAVAGLDPDSHLATVIAGDLPELDTTRAAGDAAAAAGRLREQAPDLAAVVLECTNLGPYRRELAECLRVPVHDIVDAVRALVAGEQAGRPGAAG